MRPTPVIYISVSDLDSFKMYNHNKLVFDTKSCLNKAVVLFYMIKVFGYFSDCAFIPPVGFFG